jgi:transcriptional regulator with XRE-family HTH domain
MLTPEQCRAARGLLGWDKLTLADKAPVAIRTLSLFEAGTRSPQRGTLTLLRQCLESAGVIFIDSNGEGAGVRLKKRGKR